MRKVSYLFAIIMLFYILIPFCIQAFELDEAIRNRIEASGYSPQIGILDQTVYASRALPLFYEKRGFLPAWIDNKAITENAKNLIKCIKSANDEALNPNDYHLMAIEKIVDQIKVEANKNRLIDLDLLLTDAFLIYASHLLAGKVNPVTIDSEWFTKLKEADIISILEDAIKKNRIRESLNSLLPQHVGYNNLKNSLVFYRKAAIKASQDVIPNGPTIKPGDTDPRIPLIVKRLILTGDYSEVQVGDVLKFDGYLVEAIELFQKRHGLDIDGNIGPKTVELLNKSIDDRIDQIKLNLERWRWLPQNLGENYILVNIANFQLDVYEGTKSILDMRVVVGKTYRRTPVFSDQVSYLVFSPFWNIPNSIATKDVLPMAKKDSLYLVNLGIRVFQGYGSEMTEINRFNIDWSSVTSVKFKYWFRQDPGPKNFLGGVKFMFPNKFNVYLHDTPAKELFNKTARDFSSGCIRLEQPDKLAIYLLRDKPYWNVNSIREAMHKGEEQTIKFSSPVPIHILYWTSWVDKNGNTHFRKDVYNRDKTLLEALNEKPSIN